LVYNLKLPLHDDAERLTSVQPKDQRIQSNMQLTFPRTQADASSYFQKIVTISMSGWLIIRGFSFSLLEQKRNEWNIWEKYMYNYMPTNVIFDP